LVTTAGSGGVPFVIYRPTLISGSTETGIGNPNDILYRFIDACLSLGSIPDLDMTINMLPVDYVSKAITLLSRRNDLLGRTFNMTNKYHTSMAEVSGCLLDLGLPVKRLSYRQWWLLCSKEPSAAALLLLLPPPAFEGSSRRPIVDLADSELETARDLALAEGVECPAISRQILGKYVGYCYQRRAVADAVVSS
jgi:nucleoside-diphosphate-sugar epimerase